MPEQRKILLAGDQKDIITELEDLLRLEGYQVVTVHTDTQRLELLERHHKPHLTILDVDSSRTDLAPLYEKIRSWEKAGGFHPFLVIAGRIHLDNLFKKFDVDGFVVKPYRIEDLLSEIATLLTQQHQTPEGDDQKKRILIVENDPTALGQIILAFTGRGYRIETATTGAAGLEKAFANVPDLVLTNLGLPDIAGDMVALKLRHRMATRDTPVLIYVGLETNLDASILKRLNEKTGSHKIILSADPQVLLREAGYKLSV